MALIFITPEELVLDMPVSCSISKRQFVLTGGSTLALALSGCSTPNQGQTPTRASNSLTHLLTYFHTTKQEQIWANVSQRAAEQSSQVLEVDLLGFGTYIDDLERRMQNNYNSGSVPEIISGQIARPNRIQQIISKLLTEDKLAPATDLNKRLERQIGPFVGSHIHLAGENWIVPHEKQASTIHYREDIYKQLSIEPPTTWENFLTAARTISEDDSVDMAGVIVPTEPGYAAGFFEDLLRTLGVDIFRWKSENQATAEVWFPKDQVVNTLSFIQQLADYAPEREFDSRVDPLLYWSNGKAATMYGINAMGTSPALSAALRRINNDRSPEKQHEKVLNNTNLAPVPRNSNTESQLGQGSPGFNGHFLYSESDNLNGARDVITDAIYDNLENLVEYYSYHPMRYLPAYEEVLKNKTYTASESFDWFPNILKLNQKIVNEIVPLESEPDLLTITPATLYVKQYGIIPDMVISVLKKSKCPSEAYNLASRRLKTRLNEGRSKFTHLDDPVQ